MDTGEPIPGAASNEAIKQEPDAEGNIGVETNLVPKTEPLLNNETELPHYVQYRDVFSSACLEELADKLATSQGKALFVVHPFYLENTWYVNHLKEVVQGNVDDKQLTEFVQRMKETLPRLIEKGVPVIVLQELEYLGDNHLEEEERIKSQYEAFCSYLRQISDEINPNSLFIMYTERGGPYPLRSKNKESKSWMEVIKHRMEVLKSAGLKIGIVAGREFKPSEGDQYEYYASANDKDYGWSKTADKSHGGFLLKDYYDETRKGETGQHPLQVIRPDQCVGELLRMLAMNGLRPAITTLTYPDQIRTASNYIKHDYNGKKVYTLKQK